MPTDKTSLCLRLGHEFSRPALLEEALTHRSFDQGHNERLEFLGDAVLGLAIGEAIYLKFPQVDEGKLTRWRATLVNESTLAEVARDLGLGRALHLGQGERQSGGSDRSSILADALEALLGAVYLDGGFAVVRKTVTGLFHDRIERLHISGPKKDPKTRLQEYLQSHKMPLPCYQIVKVTGKSHSQHFTVECRVPGHDHATIGLGSTRRGAEQGAAEQALQEWERVNSKP